jgi:ADP-ribosylglycohydrolase
MDTLRLTPSEYADRVLGGWLGKNVGSTLGGPYEGHTEPTALTFYDPVPVQPSANDDLDLELLWLHALEEHGTNLTSADLAAEWLAHMRYPWDEYGYATFNLRRGLMPPLCGSFNNWFRNSMGATIRAEIWAMMAPGSPDVAAQLGQMDAVLDHAEEGVWALMFLAALESAAFFETDANALLDTGLARIPAASRIARAVREVRQAFLGGETALQARARVLSAVGHSNVTDTAQNLGFIALGLLYGKGDFGASVCGAVNCGYDTDTTGATVGSILGIMRGAAQLPREWLDPIGENVVVGWGVTGLPAPATVRELTERTVAMGMRMVAERCPGVLIAETPAEPVAEPAAEPVAEPAAEPVAEPAAEPAAEPDAPDPSVPSVASAPSVPSALPPPSDRSVYRSGPFEFIVDYGAQGPVVRPGAARTIVIEIVNLSDTLFTGQVEVRAPAGWRVAVPGAQGPSVRMEPGKRVRLGYVVKAPEAGPASEQAIELALKGSDGVVGGVSMPLFGAACWWVVGPLPNNWETGYDHSFPVELKPDLKETYLGRGGGLVGWERQAYSETVMNVEPIFGGIPGIAYARTTLRLPEATDARIIVHTNDGARVWLNGRVVYQVHSHDPFRPSLCSGPGADVHLAAGENALMVKMARCSEPYAFAMSIVDRDGNPLRELGNTRW